MLASYISDLPGVGHATLRSPQEGKKNQRCEDEGPGQVDYVLPLFLACEQATTNMIVRASWAKPDYNMRNGMILGI
jgi:hypothetical protein